jgi:Zn-dependent protease with chaperone function
VVNDIVEMKFQADYYDGLSACAKPVLVRVIEHTKNISFELADESFVFNFVDLNVQAKLGATKRVIDLPNGGRLEASDITELELVMPSKQNAFWRGLHYLENHLGWVFVAMLATVFAGWLFLQFGVPTLAEYVAKATPLEMEAKLGEQALEGLDSQFGYFTKSKLDAKNKASISVALAKLCVAMKDCPKYRLEFRAGGMIGANAFALPGGIMVVTDELVKLAKNDTEIIAVLAHELGHVKRRHAFRQSIQGVLSGLILAAVTGDVSAVASGLPAALMQMRYSRLHESEADNFALTALQKACLPPRAFADILMRLETQMHETYTKKSPNNKTQKNQAETKNEKNLERQSNHKDVVSEMLATHPDTQARVKPFLKAKQNCK